MVYVAFLRGINVGGKSIVSMAAIKEALVDLGLSNVRTYINSGNVVFSTRASDSQKLGARIEKALEERTGIPIKVLVMDLKSLKKLVDAIPRNWVDDRTMRTYVLLLWTEIDDRKILERLPVRPGGRQRPVPPWGCDLAGRPQRHREEPYEQDRRHALLQADHHPQRKHDAQAQRAVLNDQAVRLLQQRGRRLHPRSGGRHRLVDDDLSVESRRELAGRWLSIDLIDGRSDVEERRVAVLQLVAGVAVVAADLEFDVSAYGAEIAVRDDRRALWFGHVLG